MKRADHRPDGVRLLQPTTKGFREWLRGVRHCPDCDDRVAGHAASRVFGNPSWPRSESLAELRGFALREYGTYTVAQVTAAWREWRRARELAVAQARGARGERVELPPVVLVNGPYGGVRWFASEEPVPTSEELTGTTATPTASESSESATARVTSASGRRTRGGSVGETTHRPLASSRFSV